MRAKRGQAAAGVVGVRQDGRYIIVIYEEIDNETIYPMTAYDVAEP